MLDGEGIASMDVRLLLDVDDNAHDPVLWKNSLYHFAQRIFGRGK